MEGQTFNERVLFLKAAGELGEQAIMNVVIASIQFYGLFFGAIIILSLCVHHIA